LTLSDEESTKPLESAALPAADRFLPVWTLCKMRPRGFRSQLRIRSLWRVCPIPSM